MVLESLEKEDEEELLADDKGTEPSLSSPGGGGFSDRRLRSSRPSGKSEGAVEFSRSARARDIKFQVERGWTKTERARGDFDVAFHSQWKELVPD